MRRYRCDRLPHVQNHPRAAVRITTCVNRAAKAARVAAERAVKDIQGRTADEETFAINAAAGSSRVAAEGTVGDRQRRAAVVTFIADAAAITVHGRVTT